MTTGSSAASARAPRPEPRTSARSGARLVRARTAARASVRSGMGSGGRRHGRAGVVSARLGRAEGVGDADDDDGHVVVEVLAAREGPHVGHEGAEEGPGVLLLRLADETKEAFLAVEAAVAVHRLRNAVGVKHEEVTRCE